MPRQSLLYSLAVVALFALDRLLKHLSLSGAHFGEPGALEFSLFRNTGIAFSLPLMGALYWPLALGFIVVLVALLIRRYRAKDPSVTTILLILAGAASNLLDRAQQGFVTDYLIFPGLFSSQGAINLADIMIVAGLLWLSWRKPAPSLVRPNERYKASFLAASAEIARKNPEYDVGRVTDENFAAYVLEREARRAEAQDGSDRVPATEFWLVENDHWLGRVDIRHRLNEKLERYGGHVGYVIAPQERGKGYGGLILELALPKIKEIGIRRILLTCSDQNLPSRKIIERHGGMLQDTIPREGGEQTCRYWIELD